MRKETIIIILLATLILLWAYTLGSKLGNPLEFKSQLANQVFSARFTYALFYLLPITELMAIVLLLVRPWYGFLFSAGLMFIFTGYISLILLGFYPRVPCACGGVIASLNWTGHLIFNICYTVVAVIGCILTIKERRLLKLKT